MCSTARSARAILYEFVVEWGAGNFLSSIPLEGSLPVVQATIDFCMTEYAVERYNSSVCASKKSKPYYPHTGDGRCI